MYIDVRRAYAFCVELLPVGYTEFGKGERERAAVPLRIPRFLSVVLSTFVVKKILATNRETTGGGEGGYNTS